MNLGMNSKRIMDWFVPATSNINPEGEIVLPTGFLALENTGSPGIFLFPGDIQYISQQSYNLSNIEDKLFLDKRTVRYSFCPALETTVIPMDFHGNEKLRVYGIEVKKINYFFHPMGQKSLSGYRATVKLEFMIWHAKKWTRRFQINGAVLLDPKFRYLLMNPDTPVCFLGMDFMIKHPHLLFEPEYNSRHELEFRLAEGPFVDRSYGVSTDAWKEVIVHVDGYHNMETGNIGCGVFFKSKSIFNFFGGVSKCDTFGNKLEGLWRERGILVAIVKALQIFEVLSVESDSSPKTLIIRTSSSEIDGMLAPIKWFATRIRPPYEDQRVQALENIFPPTVRDVAMYYYHTFVRRQPGFKIKIQHVASCEKSGGILAAGLLATAGAEMDEFCMTIGNELKSGPLWGYHNTIRSPSLDTIPLETHPGLGSNSIYVSFGTGGYFLILREKACVAIHDADKAGLGLSTENVVNKSESAPGQTKVTMPNSFKNSAIRECGPHDSSYPTAGTRAPKGFAKRKPETALGESLQKPKGYYSTVPQKLSEFDNDWNPQINDVARNRLEVTKLVQINFVRYPPYPTKRVTDCHGQEPILKGAGRMADVQEKRTDEPQARENMSHGGILKGLDMWKIESEVSNINATGGNGMCGMDCECRIEGECACQLGCRCEVELISEVKGRSESRGVNIEQAVREDKTNKTYIHHFPDRGGYGRYTGSNRPQAAEVKPPDFKGHIMVKSGLPDSEILTDEGWLWGPISKHTEGNAEMRPKVSINEKSTDVIRYSGSKTVEPPIEHKARLKGYVRSRGIPHLYESKFEESIHCELPSCPEVISPTQTTRFSEEDNFLKSSGISGGRELLEWTPAVGCAQTQKYSEGQKHRKGIRHESRLTNCSIDKDEAWLEEF